MTMSPAAQLGEYSTPVEVRFGTTQDQRRLTVLVRFILAIPQFVVLGFVGIAAFFVLVLGWFAALFTGRLPASFARFLLGYVRWSTRVFAYAVLMTDKYPPFALDPDPSYPIDVTVTTGRLNRAAVLFRLILAIPAGVVAGVLTYGVYGFALITWVITLVAGRMPDAIFGASAAAIRYQARYLGYFSMLTSSYPGDVLGDKDTMGRRLEGSASGTPPDAPPPPPAWAPGQTSAWSGVPGVSAPVPPPPPPPPFQMPRPATPGGVPADAPAPPAPPAADGTDAGAGTTAPLAPGLPTFGPPPAVGGVEGPAAVPGSPAPVPTGTAPAADVPPPVAPDVPPASPESPVATPPSPVPTAPPPPAPGYPVAPVDKPSEPSAGAPQPPPPPPPPYGAAPYGAAPPPPPPPPPPPYGASPYGPSPYGAQPPPPPPYGATPYGPSPYGGPPYGGPAFVSGPPRIWPLVLTKGARTMTIVFIVLGALLQVGYQYGTRHLVTFQSLEASLAADQTRAAYNQLDGATQTFKSSTQACADNTVSQDAQLLCVENATRTWADALQSYGQQVGQISFPASAQADAQAVQTSVNAAVSTLQTLASAPDLQTYSADASDPSFASTLDQVDTTYNELIAQLTS